MNIDKNKYPIILFSIGVLFFILFQIAGAEVSTNGILRESFWMIPLGYSFIFISILWALFILLKKRCYVRQCGVMGGRTRCIKNIFINITLFVIGFIIGSRFTIFQYQDICIDLGGGVNPEVYDICVVETSL